MVDFDPKVSAISEKFIMIGPIEVVVKTEGLHCFDIDTDIHILTQESDVEGLESWAIRHPGFTWNLNLVRGGIVGFLKQKHAWIFGNLFEKLKVKSQEVYLRATSTVYKCLDYEGDLEPRQKAIIMIPLHTEDKILYTTQVLNEYKCKFYILDYCPWPVR